MSSDLFGLSESFRKSNDMKYIRVNKAKSTSRGFENGKYSRNKTRYIIKITNNLGICIIVLVTVTD